MTRIVEWAVKNTRVVIAMMVVVIVAGVMAFMKIPKEAQPDIPITVLTVQVTYPGISPEDSERLLVKPLETALRSDFALIHAFLADYLGNLAYALTARNFNPTIAMAADTVLVTAEHIVPVGVIAPDHIVTPAPVVDYLIANA